MSDSNHCAENDSSSSTLISIPRSFPLTELEQKIFGFLLDIKDKRCPEVVLRVAGGWVRDKLLGKSPHDIDIALNMAGGSFTEIINQQLLAEGQEERHVGIIKANPRAGKHLEIATLKLFDVFVDFVNLRASKYAIKGNELVVGTPLEDAYHRDLTINSMFYNINTDTVEDWTGKDLDERILQTPIPPYETFADDGCRILRTLRFASKYSFKIKKELIDVIREHGPNLLSTTVRERIGREIEDILSNPHPEIAFRLITSLQLIGVILDIPPTVHVITPAEGLICETNMEKVLSLHKSMPTTFASTLPLVLISSYLMPFSAITYGVKTRTLPIIFYILSESLKTTKKTSDTVLLFTTHCSRWRLVLEALKSDPSHCINRVEVGLLLRTFKELWVDSLFIATALSMPSHNDQASASLAMKLYQQVVSQVESEKLVDVWGLRPFVKGDELTNNFGVTKGPLVADILQQQICWQIENPHLGLDECVLWLKDITSKK